MHCCTSNCSTHANTTQYGRLADTSSRFGRNAFCYCLSMRLNCFCGTCSGLETWQTRCTTGALSVTRHVILSPMPPLIVIVVARLNGGVNPMMPVSYMTRASAPALVPFPQLSPHVPSLSSNHSQSLRFGSAGDRLEYVSYCFPSPHVYTSLDHS